MYGLGRMEASSAERRRDYLDFSRLYARRVPRDGRRRRAARLALAAVVHARARTTRIRGSSGASGGDSASAWAVFSTLDWLLVLACLAPFILSWIVARGHKLTWKPGEVTMVVGITAFVLILCNGIILGRPGDCGRHRPGHRLLRRVDRLGRDARRRATCARPSTPARASLPASYSVRLMGVSPRPQPGNGARANDRVRGAGLRALDRPRRQGGSGRRRRGCDAPAARHGLDGRRGRDRRGREGRGADALQRRAHRRRHRRPRWTSRSTRSRGRSCARRACRTRSPRSPCRSAARCSIPARASTC